MKKKKKKMKKKEKEEEETSWKLMKSKTVRCVIWLCF